MKKVLVNLAKTIAFLALLIVMVCGLTYFFSPNLSYFYAEKDYDVVFFGASQTYSTFSTTVFDEYNLSTYNRSRQQAPAEYIYYYMKDAVEYADFDVAVLEITTFAFDDEKADSLKSNECSVTDSTFNDMRNSLTKVEAIVKTVPKEDQASYLFPLAKYHENWKELSRSSFDKSYKMETWSDRGYIAWQTEEPGPEPNPEDIFSDETVELRETTAFYLEKIYELCQENDIELLLVKSPFYIRRNSICVTNKIEEWAEEKNVHFLNYMRLADEIGIDYSTDTMDGGYHANESGANKVSHHLAQYILDTYYDGEK